MHQYVNYRTVGLLVDVGLEVENIIHIDVNTQLGINGVELKVLAPLIFNVYVRSGTI